MAKPTRINVDVTGIPEAKADLDRFWRAVRAGEKKGMTDVVLAVQGRAKRSFGRGGNLKRQTGRLSRAIVTQVQTLSRGVRGTVGVLATVAYGRIHEYGGTIKHPGSRPRRKKALAWTKGTTRLGMAMGLEFGVTRKQAFGLGRRSKGGKFVPEVGVAAGDVIFAMSTKPHPIEIPPRPYLRPSLKEERPKMEAKFARRINAALGRA